MDSKEELLIYEFIKQNFNIKIKAIGTKKKNKFYNEKSDEYYCPDFMLYVNDKKVIVEYFGLFRETDINHIMGKGYHDKTLRKIEYFNSLEEYYFISIFSRRY